MVTVFNFMISVFGTVLSALFLDEKIPGVEKRRRARTGVLRHLAGDQGRKPSAGNTNGICGQALTSFRALAQY
jgi:hypothetical protein